MTYPKFCRDCKWSEQEKNNEWTLRCQHPVVNANDNYALAATQVGRGVSCQSVRDKKWPAKCGMRGALWEQKP